MKRDRDGSREQGHQESDLDPPSGFGRAPTPPRDHHTDALLYFAYLHFAHLHVLHIYMVA
jgi:hypothetical protein